MTKPYKYILFWITSSRGTDEITVRKYRHDITKEDIEEDLERWCSGFAAWESSGNYINYGFKSVKDENRNVLLARYKKLCIRKNKIDKQYKELRARLTPHDWSKRE